MKNKQSVPIFVIAAAAITGYSIFSLCARRKRHARQQHEIEEASQVWEAEGGALPSPVPEEVGSGSV
jgi:hypothetical protein